MPLLLQEGRLQMELPDFGEGADGLGAELDATFDRYCGAGAGAGCGRGAPVMPPAELPSLEADAWCRWRSSRAAKRNPMLAGSTRWTSTATAVEELIVLRANIAHATSVIGRDALALRGRREDALGRRRATSTATATLELLLGSADEHHLRARRGHAARTAAPAPRAMCRCGWGASSVRLPRVGALAVGDDGRATGRSTSSPALMNANLLRYDLDFNEVWRLHQTSSTARMRWNCAISTATARSRSSLGNHYGAVEIFDESGADAVFASTRSLAMCRWPIGDLSGDGVPEIANGSSTGAFICCGRGGPDEGFSFPELRLRLHRSADGRN
jgi:hypothetical protein